MKRLAVTKYVLGLVALSVWGVVLSDNHGGHEVPVIHYISVGIHLGLSWVWGYSIYHNIRYKRCFAWHCFLFEHNTCMKSHNSKKQAAFYSKPENDRRWHER